MLLVSLPLSIFSVYLITKSRQTKIIHINLSYAAYFNIAQVYMIVFVRLLLFVLKITCAVEGINDLIALGDKTPYPLPQNQTKVEKPTASSFQKAG